MAAPELDWKVEDDCDVPSAARDIRFCRYGPRCRNKEKGCPLAHKEKCPVADCTDARCALWHEPPCPYSFACSGLHDGSCERSHVPMCTLGLLCDDPDCTKPHGKECKNGDGCSRHKRGTCFFAHRVPPEVYDVFVELKGLKGAELYAAARAIVSSNPRERVVSHPSRAAAAAARASVTKVAITGELRPLLAGTTYAAATAPRSKVMVAARPPPKVVAAAAAASCPPPVDVAHTRHASTSPPPSPRSDAAPDSRVAPSSRARFARQIGRAHV